ncbi:MAG: NADPH-dependent FMN reductase [Chthoniobacterales bacterium]
MILIISSSHHPESKSRILAQAARKAVQEEAHEVDFFDLRDLELPLCDGHSTYEHPLVKEAASRVEAASGILLSTPIYNYDANAITKSFIEHTGKAWQGKPVGLLCAAGGKGSYMALLPLAGSLMLDFHCHVLPQQVYATSDQFSDTAIIDPGINARIKKIVADICWLSEAVAARQGNR